MCFAYLNNNSRIDCNIVVYIHHSNGKSDWQIKIHAKYNEHIYLKLNCTVVKYYLSVISKKSNYY